MFLSKLSNPFADERQFIVMLSRRYLRNTLLTISATATSIAWSLAPSSACGLCGDSYHYLLDPSVPLVAPGTGNNPVSGEIGTFDINIVAQSGLSSNAAALAAFNRAAARWESFLGDSITVNIDADLTTTGFANPNIIGQAGSAQFLVDYDTLRNTMVNDVVGESAQNVAVVNALPTNENFTATLPTGFTLATASGNATQKDMAVNSAILKALGFGGLGGVTDGEITFNANFSFDYDNSNGVTPGLTDFETVALHEIGHVLGFISSVDDVAFFLENGQTAAIQATSWDLFRFQNGTVNDPSTLPQFTANARFLSTGGDAIFDDTTNEYRLSTGVNDGGTQSDGSGTDLTPVALRGDGRQASHWKDNNLTGTTIGIMDPTLGAGEVFSISQADLTVLDLVGYEVTFQPVPAPPAAVSLGIGAIVGLLGFGSKKFRARSRRNKLPH